MTRRAGWIIGGAAAAVVLTVATIWLLAPRGGSAEDVALDYVRALESGDLDAVAAVGVEVSEDAAAAFSGASVRPSGATVESADVSGDEATVAVSFSLGDERHEADFHLARDGGRWLLDAESALGELRITAASGTPVQVGEAMIPADSSLAMLPAQYDLATAPTGLLDGEARAEVMPGTVAEVTVDAALRAEATDAAQEQLNAHLAACAEPAATVAEHCGIRIPWAADLTEMTGIRYRIEELPTLTLSLTEFHADDGVLVATVSGTGHDGAERSVTYRTQDWSLRGDVSFTPEDIVLSVW